MKEEGSIIELNGTYVMERGNIQLPSSIEGVVHQRLQTLEPDAMALAEYASCIGKEFDCNVVRSLPSLVDPDLALENLENSGIIVMKNDSAEFCHAIFHNVTYESVADRWKAAYHKSIGEYYESAYRGKHDEVLYELARHYANSNEHRKALDFCVKAGEKAESSFAPEQAIEFYRKALAISTMKNHTPSINLQERLGDLYWLRGDFEDSIGIYRAVTEASSDVNHKADIHRKIADVYEKKSEFENGKEECRIGLALLADDISIEKTKLYTTLGNIEMRMGEYDEAKAILTKSLDIASKLDNKFELGRINHIIGSTFLYQGDYKGALSNLESAMKLRDEAGDLGGYSASMNNIGNIYAHTGEYKKALEYYEPALEIAKKIGNKMGMANTLTNIASVHLGEGDSDKAIELMEQSIAIEKQIGDMRGAAITLVNVNVAYYKKGDYTKALEIMNESKSICLRYDLKYVIIYVYTGLSELARITGDPELGLKHANDAMVVSREIGTIEGEAMSYLNIGSNYIEIDELDKAEEDLLKAQTIMEELSHNQLGDLYYNFGLLYKRKGNFDLAKEYLDRSRSSFMDMGNDRSAEKVQKELDELEK